MADGKLGLPPKVSSDAENMDKLVAMAEGKMATSGEMLTIACKIPMGMRLQVCKKVIMPRKTEGGLIRDTEEYHRFGKEYIVYGPAHPQNMGPHCTIIGDYALTPNIPKEHYDLWYSQHRNDPMVLSRAIFANSSNKINGEAKEYRATKSGLERLDSTKLPKGMKPDKDHMDANAYNKMVAGKESDD